ncbi:MAG: DNA recombination protein RmuC [Gammaproteobacteria bacterium]|jgi:DNA recombination protein RmuC
MEAIPPHYFVIIAVAAIASLLIYFAVRLRILQKKLSLQNEALTESNHQLETELALAKQREGQSQQLNQALRQSLDIEQIQLKESQQSLVESEKISLKLKADLQREQALSDQKLAQFEESKIQLKVEFENLAGKILDEKAKTFNQNSQASIETLLKPFRDQIEGFQKRVNEVHSDSIKGNSAIEAEIKKVLEAGLKIGDDAKNLTSALKGDSQKRGGWGEAQLERTLEMSGLISGAHFEKQSSFKDADGNRKQTDYLINVPGGKQIIIDSKVSLVAYDRVVAADTPEAETLALTEHANSVKRHVDDLSGKDYTNLIGIRSPSFVLMFMPIEPAYIEALKFEKDLFNYGYERNIILVSHTTLIPILRTVANLWMIERSNKEAREIGEKAGDIFNQVCEVAIRMKKLGANLSTASNTYNDTLKAIVGRQGLHGKVERFEQLSNKVSKSMPELEPLHNDLNHETIELIAEVISENPDSID